MQGSDFIDLRPFANQVFSDVYDILRQQFRPLLLGFPIYGNIAVGRSNTAQMDLFVTGITDAAGSFPFMMRLQVDFQANQFALRVIATGVVGSSACGAGGSGALVFIPRTLTTFSCTTFQATLLRSEDVAISPPDNGVYMTVSEGAVLRLPPFVQ